MALVLSVEDREDGTGANATVTGSAGALVTLFRRLVSGDLDDTAWTEAGNRVGDGAISADAPVGYYWWYAESGEGLGTNVAGVWVTGPFVPGVFVAGVFV